MLIGCASGRVPVSRFVGTWRLVRALERQPDGRQAPFADVGVLMYDSGGRMAGQLMRRDRPAFSAGDPKRGTAQEMRAAFDGYDAYFGRYRVDTVTHIVTHQVEGGLFPNEVDTTYRRRYRFAGDSLLLTPFDTNEHWSAVFVREQ